MKNLEIKRRRLEDRVISPESTIAAGTKFLGNIKGAEGISLSGQLEGNITSQGLVRIHRDAKMTGMIKAPFVIIEGKLTGNISSAEQVELRSGSRMSGNIKTARVAIAEDSFFEGKINMPVQDSEPQTFVEKRVERGAKPETNLQK